ncbi:Transcriptional regulator [Lachnellula occidentalis]|uniref:Transcriptional regulator n=1 Tax=Lachnellula occidentalis TaxID=215460 RepID=A0A8H8S1E4_9HELO|nr:Transcriptional regulator [Lachnellula occidentalis]
MDQEQQKSTADHTFNRACDACRLHKVRCLPNTSAFASTSASKACQRCTRTDRQCVFTVPQKRKQRKRTDTRVAELEREVQAMRALFETKKQATDGPDASAQPSKMYLSGQVNTSIQSTGTVPICPPDIGGTDWTPTPFQTPAAETSLSQDWTTSAFSMNSDVIDRGVLSMEVAIQLFRTYMSDLYPQYPAVPFPQDTPPEEVRRTQPILFLAVIAAAAGKTDPHLYSTLNSEVLSAYAHRTVIRSEKSLELVKAMIVSVVWYYPPGKFSQLKFYEYIHMAATMAMDIGIGTNPNPSRSRRGLDSASSLPVDEGEMERRRAFLVCFLITTGVSMSMRRPNMLRSNSWLKECLEYVDANANPLYLDNCLVAWVSILQITEEICTSFSFDDPGNMANLAETRIQITLSGFEKKLLAWKEKFTSTGAINDALMLTYHHTQIYLHEICMHDDHSPEDFQPPYRLEKVVSIQSDIHASSSYIDAIAITISSAHALLDLILHMEVERLRALPIFNFVRMAYASIVLTKLHISSRTPESQIGAVIEPKLIRLGYYLEALIEKLGVAVGPMECRAPFTFLGFLMRLQIWFKSQEKDVRFRQPTELYTVLDHCWLPPPPNVGKNPDFMNEPMYIDQKTSTGLDGKHGSNIGSMGLTDLATMQPMPDMDIDFGNMDENQFLTFEGMEFARDDGDWSGLPNLNDLNMHNIMNDTQMQQAYNWGPQDASDTFQ